MVGFPSDGGLLTSGVTGTTALGLSAVWRCLDILSNGVTQLQWEERRGNLNLPPSRLVQQPLQNCTRRDWTSYVVRSLALYDIAYLWHVGGYDAEGVPVGLWPVSPSYVTTTQTSYPILPFVTPDIYYIGTEKVPRENICILRRGTNVGIADWAAGIISIARIKFAETLAADAYASRYWQAGGSPTTVLETDADLNDTEANELSDRWLEKRSRGPDHAPVMSSGIKAHAMGADPTAQAAVEARRELVADIGRYFGIPSHILNSPQGDSETYHNSESGNLNLLRYTLQNYIDAIQDGISELLPGGRHVVMDTRPLLYSTQLARAQSFQLLTGGKAILDVDEAREELGLPPAEAPDRLNPPNEASPPEYVSAGGPDSVQAS